MLNHATTSVFVSNRNLHYQRTSVASAFAFLELAGSLCTAEEGRAGALRAGWTQLQKAQSRSKLEPEREREREERNNLLDRQVGDRVSGRANKISPALLGNQTVGERARRRKDNLRKERRTSNYQVRK